MKKTLILVIVSILMLSIVYSDITTDLDHSYSFDTDCSDEVGSEDCSVNGATQTGTGGGCDNSGYYSFDGDDDLSFSATLHTTGDKSICWWSKLDNVVDSHCQWGTMKDCGFSGSDDGISSTSVATDMYGQVGNGGGAGQYFQISNTIPAVTTDWHFYCVVLNDTNDGCVYIDGASDVVCDTTLTPSETTPPDNNMKIGDDSGATDYSLEGDIDQFMVWSRKLEGNEIQSLFDTTCNPVLAGPVNDTTPPVITNVNQDPSNLTILNALSNDWIINATITDDIKLNLSTIKLYSNATHIEIYINGTKLDQINREQLYTNNKSDVFNWSLDENFFLSGTHLINHEIFENYTHDNSTLTSNNHWLKMKFLNVTNTSDLMFTEIMDDNSTGIAEYYYCNENYITGNPISSDYCGLFYTQGEDDIIHQHNGKQYHRLMVMNLNVTAGTIAEIKVTPISYILKRGSTEIERYYHIPVVAREDTITITNNNGNTWNNQLYTVDAQIHQIHENESFYYQICAEDNSTNKACSSVYNDTIDFVKLPPTSPIFFNPIQYNYYNGTIEIQYSPSSSPTGQTIVSYKLEYKINTSGTWETIITNNYPKTSYDWDITNVVNGNYNIRITVTDSEGYVVKANSPEFIISNVESLNTQLLTDIKDKIDTTNSYLNNIYGEIQMMSIYLLWFGLILVGYWLTITGNSTIGLVFLIASGGVSATIWQLTDTTFPYISMLFGGLTVGSVVMWLFIRSKKKPNQIMY